jgi:hypothetical protein
MQEDPFQILTHPFEKSENPQTYAEDVFAYVHKKPARHVLGLVGGNEVSLPQGNMVDVESDLRRLNIPLTQCPSREYQPPPNNQHSIIRNSTKGKVIINVQQRHLPSMQMWPYAATFAPVPMKVEQCGRPEKY